MSLNFKKLAEVIRGVADYVEEVELQKHASEQREKSTRVEKLAQGYELATGEALPASVQKKLASLDPEALDYLVRTHKTASESPEALGMPADRQDTPVPRTVKEAAQQAEDPFTN